jgi:hypothetical protein
MKTHLEIWNIVAQIRGRSVRATCVSDEDFSAKLLNGSPDTSFSVTPLGSDRSEHVFRSEIEIANRNRFGRFGGWGQIEANILSPNIEIVAPLFLDLLVVVQFEIIAPTSIESKIQTEPLLIYCSPCLAPRRTVRVRFALEAVQKAVE